MQRKSYSTTINAPRKKVWEVLWSDSTYRQWTSVFSEGSYAESDWKEGSKIHFLTPEGHGMYSIIAKKTPEEYMSFKHVGEIKNGKEIPVSEQNPGWENAFENYTLKEKNGKTELFVELDSVDEYLDFFNETFPKALQKVKELAEG